MVLDGPSLGIPLPIIGSPEPEEDTPTPMVETKDFAAATMVAEDRRNRNKLGLNGIGHRREDSQQQQQQWEMMANNNSVRLKAVGRPIISKVCF